jgi:hypothetical protein
VCVCVCVCVCVSTCACMHMGTGGIRWGREELGGENIERGDWNRGHLESNVEI